MRKEICNFFCRTFSLCKFLQFFFLTRQDMERNYDFGGGWLTTQNQLLMIYQNSYSIGCSALSKSQKLFLKPMSRQISQKYVLERGMIAVILGLFSDLVNLGGNDNWGGEAGVEGDYSLNWSKHHLSPFRSTCRFQRPKMCYKKRRQITPYIGPNTTCLLSDQHVGFIGLKSVTKRRQITP